MEIASSGEHLSLSPGEIAKLVRVTVAAGLIAGIVGMGGGMVLSPVLMNMGVAPQVMTLFLFVSRCRAGQGNALPRTSHRATLLGRDLPPTPFLHRNRPGQVPILESTRTTP